MSRHQKDPLRPLTADERKELTRLSRSLSAPAAQVERARVLLAIAEGASYTAAAHQVGRRHTETLSAWASGAGLWSAAARGGWRTSGSPCATTGLASSTSRCCRAHASSWLQNASLANSENCL